MNNCKTCVIDVGGGQRGIFGAGVFDRCLDEGVTFDCCIGVSAGGANVMSFLGGQKGRNYAFYHEYVKRKDYMSLSNLLRKGSYIDLDYIYGTLSKEGGENPLDYDRIAAFDGRFYIVATDAATGEPVYFEQKDVPRNDYRALNASSCLPVMCRPVAIDGVAYYDGGVADPVPLEKALGDGAEKIVLILTRPPEFVMDGKFENVAAKLLEKKYPACAAALRDRPRKYNEAVTRAKELAKEGRCLIVAPSVVNGTGTVEKDAAVLEELYQEGYRAGERIKAFLMQPAAMR